MALQKECDQNIDAKEYEVFTSLRAGGSTQVLCILRELASSNMAFESESTASLIFQSLWEVGTPGPQAKAPFRETHFEFLQPTFCWKILVLIEKLMKTVGGS